MDTLEFDYFFKRLSEGDFIDETQFYFLDDPLQVDRFLGYLPQFDNPYWIGDCDIEGGCDFETAEELVNAPVYDGRSLAERWDMVRIINIEGICLEDWLKMGE